MKIFLIPSTLHKALPARDGYSLITHGGVLLPVIL